MRQSSHFLCVLSIVAGRLILACLKKWKAKNYFFCIVS